MFNPLAIFFPKKMVGIDIGTASIKMVEVFSWGKFKKLHNYSEVKSSAIPGQSLTDLRNSNGTISSNLAAVAIKEMLVEAKIKTKQAIFSIPDFYTFCTSFDIPQMPEKEIPGAIRYNASQYITLPISDVTLDWRVVSNVSKGSGDLMKVFIVAVPNQVIEDYKTIAKNAGLELRAVEAEVFGVARSLVSENKKTLCLIDIGAQSSTINMVEQGFLKKSYSSNFGNNQLVKALSVGLAVSSDVAEETINKEGLNSLKSTVLAIIKPLIDSFLSEVKNISADFLTSEQKTIEEIYLTGGTAYLPGLKEYIAKNVGKPVSTPDCFSEVLYPPVLKEMLTEANPRFAAAIGVALDGLEI